MTTLPSPVTGIVWYRREDYPRILKVMEDSRDLPANYDAWRRTAERTEREIGKFGHRLRRATLDPEQFLAWCVLRGLRPNASARAEFAADPINWDETR